MKRFENVYPEELKNAYLLTNKVLIPFHKENDDPTPENFNVIVMGEVDYEPSVIILTVNDFEWNDYNDFVVIDDTDIYLYRKYTPPKVIELLDSIIEKRIADGY